MQFEEDMYVRRSDALTIKNTDVANMEMKITPKKDRPTHLGEIIFFSLRQRRDRRDEKVYVETTGKDSYQQ